MTSVSKLMAIIKQNKLQKKKRKLGMQNVRSINGKDNKLVTKFGKVGLDFLTVTEAKNINKKNMTKIDNGHVFIYCGVKNPHNNCS